MKKYLLTKTNITNKSDGSQVMIQPQCVFKLKINKNNIFQYKFNNNKNEGNIIYNCQQFTKNKILFKIAVTSKK